MTAQPIRIRPCRPSDRSQALALSPRLAEGTAPWRDRDRVLAAAAGWVRDAVDAAGQPDHAVYVAEQDGIVAGLISVSERRHFTGQVDAYVGELIVRAGMERRGIASSLLAAAEAWAASRGLAFLTLETGAANLPARGLYAALGYQAEEVRLTRAIRPAPPGAPVAGRD